MFCTQCGTQVDESKNFCRNCGARIGKAGDAAPGTAPTAEPAEIVANQAAATRAVPLDTGTALPEARQRQGLGAALLVGACVVLILAAGAGIYFGTDLMRSSPKPELPQTVAQVPDPPAPTPSGAPADTLWEEAKSSAADPGAASTAPVQPQLPQAEPSNPPLDSSRKPVPGADVPPRERSLDAPPPARAAKPAEPVPASRRGAAAGIYETVRPTNVFQAPSPGAQMVANIPPGTRVNVVSSSGEWLEVHSRRGNPPGFIRRDDATLVGKGE